MAVAVCDYSSSVLIEIYSSQVEFITEERVRSGYKLFFGKCASLGYKYIIMY